MIVKVESKDGNFKRYDDCITTCFTGDQVTPEGNIKNYVLICTYLNGKDHTYPLSKGDTIYYMNEHGKTIDKIHV